MLETLSCVKASENDDSMIFEFYSHLDPRPELKRKLILVVYPYATEEENDDDDEECEKIDCRFERSDFDPVLTDGLEVGLEFTFDKE
jgi:hypothetical protein